MNVILMCRQSALFLQTRLRLNDRGSSLVEYALLVSLIAMVCLMAVAYLGHATGGRFSNVASRISTS